MGFPGREFILYLNKYWTRPFLTGSSAVGPVKHELIHRKILCICVWVGCHISFIDFILLEKCDAGFAEDCCSEKFPCAEKEGDCDHDEDCMGDLKCGEDNCPAPSDLFSCIKPDCCYNDLNGNGIDDDSELVYRITFFLIISIYLSPFGPPPR